MTYIQLEDVLQGKVELPELHMPRYSSDSYATMLQEDQIREEEQAMEDYYNEKYN